MVFARFISHSCEAYSEFYWFSLLCFLHKIFSSPAGKSKSFVKCSGHFVQLLKSL
jgi:hypothetical protein